MRQTTFTILTLFLIGCFEPTYPGDPPPDEEVIRAIAWLAVAPEIEKPAPRIRWITGKDLNCAPDPVTGVMRGWKYTSKLCVAGLTYPGGPIMVAHWPYSKPHEWAVTHEFEHARRYMLQLPQGHTPEFYERVDRGTVMLKELGY